MKNFRKTISMLMSVVMSFSLAVPAAFATDLHESVTRTFADAELAYILSITSITDTKVYEINGQEVEYQKGTTTSGQEVTIKEGASSLAVVVAVDNWHYDVYQRNSNGTSVVRYDFSDDSSSSAPSVNRATISSSDNWYGYEYSQSDAELEEEGFFWHLACGMDLNSGGEEIWAYDDNDSDPRSYAYYFADEVEEMALNQLEYENLDSSISWSWITFVGNLAVLDFAGALAEIADNSALNHDQELALSAVASNQRMAQLYYKNFKSLVTPIPR